MAVIGTVTCPKCTLPANHYKHAQGSDQWYCLRSTGGCGHFGVVSKLTGIPTTRSDRVCETCGDNFRVIGSPAGKRATQCKQCRADRPCIRPDCFGKAIQHQYGPWEQLCRKHHREACPPQRPNRIRTREELSRQEVEALRGDTCTWCGAPEPPSRRAAGKCHRLELDHIQEMWYAPELLKNRDNLQTLCWTCHKDKTNAWRRATQELARLNPLHFTTLVDTEVAQARALAQARDTKAQ